MVRKVLLLGMLAVPLAAFAQSQSDPWYIVPQVGGISPDYRRSLEDHNWLLGIGAGRELNQYLNLEFNFNFNPTALSSQNGPGRMWTYAGSLDLLGILNRDGEIAPFVSVGAGLLRDDFSGFTVRVPNDTHPLAEAGLGTYLNIWKNSDGSSAFSLRPEIEARFDAPFTNDHRTDYIAMLGFQFSFGSGIEQPAAPPPPAPAAAPPPPPPAQPAPTPAPAPPPPETHHFVIPSSGSVTLVGVRFAFNSATLTDSSDPILDDTAQGLKDHPGLKVEIQGYTDGIGSVRYNLGLSQRRADAVRRYLIGQGVDPDQLTARGYGKADPVASNATAAGRAKNRRVVLYVLSNPSAVKVRGEGKAR